MNKEKRRKSTETHTKLHYQPSAKARPIMTLKPVMARTSSRLAAAITSVGMPASTPYPSSANFSRPGTTTAGDTAATMNLRERAGGTLAQRALVRCQKEL